jgi:Tfp pilus assembly protein PilF
MRRRNTPSSRVESSADADAYEHLGDAWAEAHDTGRARSAYERALVLDPRRASARQKLDRLKVP